VLEVSNATPVFDNGNGMCHNGGKIKLFIYIYRVTDHKVVCFPREAPPDTRNGVMG